MGSRRRATGVTPWPSITGRARRCLMTM